MGVIRDETRSTEVLAEPGNQPVALEPGRPSRTAMLERQVDGLIHELELARCRIEALEAMMDYDQEAEVLTRTALVRELGRCSIAMRSRPAARSGAFLYLQIPDYGRINLTFGYGAGQLVVREVSRMVKEVVRTDDVIGRLAADEFGVVLLDATVALAGDRARELEQLVESRSISYLGEPLAVRVRTGVSRMRGFDTINDIICAAAFAARRDQALALQEEPALPRPNPAVAAVR